MIGTEAGTVPSGAKVSEVLLSQALLGARVERPVVRNGPIDGDQLTVGAHPKNSAIE
jgi:hypothetical protein